MELFRTATLPRVATPGASPLWNQWVGLRLMSALLLSTPAAAFPHSSVHAFSMSGS